MPVTLYVEGGVGEAGREEIRGALFDLPGVHDVFVEADGTVSIEGDVDPDRAADAVTAAGYDATY
jgi:hypothetical protein